MARKGIKLALRNKLTKAPEKVVIRTKAAKPLTPDELAQQRVKTNKAKVKPFDLSHLRSATGSTEPIHLFRAIRALGDQHIPVIIHLLQNESRVREHTKFKLMQPVYVVVDGNGAYVNDYYLAYVIDADSEYLRCINAEGTFIATFPLASTSIYTTTEFEKFQSDLKPASEKPVRTKTPIIGATDFEPPTINDAIEGKRIPKKRLANSDLYSLFTSFSAGSSLVAGTVHEGEKKKKKKKVDAELSATTGANVEAVETVAEAQVETKKRKKLTKGKLKKKRSTKQHDVADVEVETETADLAPWEDAPSTSPSATIQIRISDDVKLTKRFPDRPSVLDAAIAAQAARAAKSEKKKKRDSDTAYNANLEARRRQLAELDLSGYDADPGEGEPEVVTLQKKKALEQYSKPISAKVHMPLTPKSKRAIKTIEQADAAVVETSIIPNAVKEKLKKRKTATKTKTKPKSVNYDDSINVSSEESAFAANLLLKAASRLN